MRLVLAIFFFFLQGVLVRTGKYRPSDEDHATVKPDKIVENLADFVNKLLN